MAVKKRSDKQKKIRAHQEKGRDFLKSQGVRVQKRMDDMTSAERSKYLKSAAKFGGGLVLKGAAAAAGGGAVGGAFKLGSRVAKAVKAGTKIAKKAKKAASTAVTKTKKVAKTAVTKTKKVGTKVKDKLTRKKTEASKKTSVTKSTGVKKKDTRLSKSTKPFKFEGRIHVPKKKPRIVLSKQKRTPKRKSSKSRI